jgi:hypothetical protein
VDDEDYYSDEEDRDPLNMDDISCLASEDNGRCNALLDLIWLMHFQASGWLQTKRLRLLRLSIVSQG